MSARLPQRRRARLPQVEHLDERTLLSASPFLGATPISFSPHRAAVVSGSLDTPGRVDLYALRLSAGDQVGLALGSPRAGTLPNHTLQVFNSRSTPITALDPQRADARLTFQATTADTYYVGITRLDSLSLRPTPILIEQGLSSSRYDLELTRTPSSLSRFPDLTVRSPELVRINTSVLNSSLRLPDRSSFLQLSGSALLGNTLVTSLQPVRLTGTVPLVARSLSSLSLTGSGAISSLSGWVISSLTSAEGRLDLNQPGKTFHTAGKNGPAAPADDTNGDGAPDSAADGKEGPGAELAIAGLAPMLDSSEDGSTARGLSTLANDLEEEDLFRLSRKKARKGAVVLDEPADEGRIDPMVGLPRTWYLADGAHGTGYTAAPPADLPLTRAALMAFGSDLMHAGVTADGEAAAPGFPFALESTPTVALPQLHPLPESSLALVATLLPADPASAGSPLAALEEVFREWIPDADGEASTGSEDAGHLAALLGGVLFVASRASKIQETTRSAREEALRKKYRWSYPGVC